MSIENQIDYILNINIIPQSFNEIQPTPAETLEELLQTRTISFLHVGTIFIDDLPDECLFFTSAPWGRSLERIPKREIAPLISSYVKDLLEPLYGKDSFHYQFLLFGHRKQFIEVAEKTISKIEMEGEERRIFTNYLRKIIEELTDL
ncbi:MAG: hypothetical protein ACOX6V_03690 [Patescibacteria group bacterium]